MANVLAIVIPAFKASFLAKTLDSLVNQTNTSFSVYIGDDNSPEDIRLIVEKYQGRLSISYKRFNENLGGKDLAAHWNRCMSLVGQEHWIWLLPDDDVPSPECVETFLKQIDADGDRQILYRFQSEHIDENGRVLRELPVCPPMESSLEFITRKLQFQRNSSVAEYIFLKNRLVAFGNFVSLPLAWGSDDLAWVRLGLENGIATLPNGRVSLRQSKLNISNNSTSLVGQKFKAKYMFLNMLLEDKAFMAKACEERAVAALKNTIASHLFYEYRSHSLRIGYASLLQLAAKNNYIIGGGYFRNVYRLLRYKWKNEK